MAVEEMATEIREQMDDAERSPEVDVLAAHEARIQARTGLRSAFTPSLN